MSAPVLPDRPGSSLLECVAALVERTGQGRPAPERDHDACDERLSHFHALELLERHGYDAEWQYGNVDEIPAELFPVILDCKDGCCRVVLAKPTGDQAEVIAPARSLSPTRCWIGALRAVHDGLYLMCKPKSNMAQEQEEVWLFGAGIDAAPAP